LTCVAWGADRKDAVLHSTVLLYSLNQHFQIINVSVYLLTFTSEVKESAHKFLSKHKKEDKERNKESGIRSFFRGFYSIYLFSRLFYPLAVGDCKVFEVLLEESTVL
jgi:hypothetical protein